MESQTIDEKDTPEKDGDEIPVCMKCFQPVDPLAHYCPNCGEATGKFTHYLPLESIRWQASVWGKVWRQVWSDEVSVPGRLFRAIMIVWNVPIMLIGLLFRSSRKIENKPVEGNSAKDD